MLQLLFYITKLLRYNSPPVVDTHSEKGIKLSQWLELFLK